MQEVTTDTTRKPRRSTADLGGITGPSERGLHDRKPHQQELLAMYDRARQSEGSVSFPNPESIGPELVGNGRLQTTFLLPNGTQVGKVVCIGLPTTCRDPKLHELRYSPEDKGFWLRFTGVDQDGSTKESWVLIPEDTSGKDAIKSFYPHQKELHELYRAAKQDKKAIPFPNPESIGPKLIGPQGQLQMTFLLPNGTQVGKVVCIGLPTTCRDPKLHELRYSPEDKGFWLRFTGVDQDGSTKESWVLVLEDTSGKDAIKSFYPHQKELHELYRAARQDKKAIPFPNPESIGPKLIGPQGQLQISFLLPNGTQVGKTVSIGLPRSCHDPKLHELRYSPEDKGFWLRFTGVDQHGSTKESWVLVPEDTSGKDAIKSFYPHQKELLNLYRAAKQAKEAIPFPNPESIGPELVGSQGKLQISFLLPNGTQVGKTVSIGLPKPPRDQKLHELRYSPEDKGFWLRFTGVDQHESTKESWVLVLEDTSGKDAIKSFYPHQKELLDLYRAAKQGKKAIPFRNPEAIGPELAGDGRLKQTFILPNGTQVGKTASIGLPKPPRDQKLHELRYSPEDKGFWLKASGVHPKTGRTKVVEFIISDDPKAVGKDALLQWRTLGDVATESAELPPEFRRETAQQDRRFTGRCRAPRDAATEVRRNSEATHATFVKGEAFEQLIGAMLTLKHPEEQIIPQFCLRVGVNSDGKGFFGMRADYRVGDNKIVEVKWGGATQNIIDTYTRHTTQMQGRPFSYEVIMLEENPQLRERGVPYTLFSDLVDRLDSEDDAYLVTETQALIAQLVADDDGAQLLRIRDYLYSMLAKSRHVESGAIRQEAVRTALTELIIAERETLQSFLEENTSLFFNSLEANFEWAGELHTDCIDPFEYYSEHPETYELVYTFDVLQGGTLRRLVFADQLARDLAVAQEIMCGNTQEFPMGVESIRDPVFTFADGISVTPRSGAGGEGVIAVTEISELRTILQGTQLNKGDEHFGDLVGYAEAWGKRFRFRA